jgi:hypothetical protein
MELDILGGRSAGAGYMTVGNLLGEYTLLAGHCARGGGAGLGTGLQPLKVILQVIYLLSWRGLHSELGADRLELDAMIAKKRLVLFESVDEVTLLEPFLPSTGRLRRNNAALNLGLDTIRAGLIFVASHFALLAKDAASAAGQLHGGRVDLRVWMLLLLMLEITLSPGVLLLLLIMRVLLMRYNRCLLKLVLMMV